MGSTITAKELVSKVLEEFEDNSWHPALADGVRGLTAAQARWRPAPGEHCIWEHVSHLTAWTEELASRLAGNPPRKELHESPGPGWPAPPSAGGDEDWRKEVARLTAAHARLAEVVRGLDDDALGRSAASGQAVATVKIVGCVNHESYHGGQIILLRRLQGLWKPEW